MALERGEVAKEVVMHSVAACIDKKLVISGLGHFLKNLDNTEVFF